MLSYANTVLWCSQCKRIHHYVAAPINYSYSIWNIKRWLWHYCWCERKSTEHCNYVNLLLLYFSVFLRHVQYWIQLVWTVATHILTDFILCKLYSTVNIEILKLRLEKNSLGLKKLFTICKCALAIQKLSFFIIFLVHEKLNFYVYCSSIARP